MRRDLIALPDDSRVWVYQAREPIDHERTDAIKEALYNFTMQWSSHGHELDSYAHLFHHQFLVMVADGSSLPSGCSIDASVHLIEDLGREHNVDFFDRMTFAYMEDEEIKTIHKSALPSAYEKGEVSDETFFFDNLVNNKSTFLENWIVPLGESWHKKFV